MKIVINLDEYQLEHCKRHVKERYSNRLEEIIVNGTSLDDVLDKIRAEIETYQSDAFYPDDVMMNKRTVLEIIDKYRTESEE